VSHRGPLRPALLAAVAAAGFLAACTGRALFDRAKPSIERVNPKIPGAGFRILASVAGGDALTDFQISATVRQQLQDSGFTVVRRAGRWDSQPAAVESICAQGETPSMDGVLFVWYNRLELRDCVTGAMAYEITSGGREGITVLADRLIRYLRQGGAASSTAPPPS
jgi:hypothetical protein